VQPVRQRLSVGLVITAVLGVTCAVLLVTFYRAVDPLASQVAVVLTRAQSQPPDDLDLVHVCWTCDVAVAEALVFSAILLGGVPVALLGVALALFTSRLPARLARGWAGVFHAATVFQLSSLAAGIVLALVFVLVDSGAFTRNAPLAAALLAGHAGLNAVGVASWRRLQAPPKRA
jgi:hypothetical protein